MTFPSVEDRAAWTALLQQLASQEGAVAVSLHFEFEDSGVTYTGDGPEDEE